MTNFLAHLTKFLETFDVWAHPLSDLGGRSGQVAVLLRLNWMEHGTSYPEARGYNLLERAIFAFTLVLFLAVTSKC